MKRITLIFSLAVLAFAGTAKAQNLNQQDKTPIQNPLSTVVSLSPINFSYDKDWASKLGLKINNTGFDIESLKQSNANLILNQPRQYAAGKNNNKVVNVPKVDYEALVPLLVGSIKEQQRQIEALQAEVRALKGRSK